MTLSPSEVGGNSARHIAIFLSTLGIVRGGLESIAANFARSLAERNHNIAVVSGALSGFIVADSPVHANISRLRVPALPMTLFSTLGTSPRAQGRRLKLQSLTFAASCWLHPDARRLWTTADVTLSFLEIETVYLSRWRAARRLPHVSYFPGIINRHWIQKDRSHLRLAISDTLAREASGLRIDGVVSPGINESWLKEPYEVRSRVEQLFFCGRLHATKGVWELLRMFATLLGEQTTLRLRLAGDGPLRRNLETWVARSGLQANVVFLGAVSTAEVHAELRSADLFLFPTRYESFGVAVLEAQATGVPVVCSDLPIMKETTGGAALLIPYGNEDRWVDDVRSLLNDRPRRLQLSQMGRQNAARYTWRRSAALLEGYFEDIYSRLRPSDSANAP